MDAKQVREFQARWQVVAAVEAAERRAATMEERWQQFNALMRMSHSLGLGVASDTRKRQENVVRKRWLHLKTEWLERADEAE